MKKLYVVLLLAGVVTAGVFSCRAKAATHAYEPEKKYKTPTYMPKEGYVPDEKTAISIAEAVLIPIYGEENIRSERPFTATLKNGVWSVEGTLPKEFEFGGVAKVTISKKTGEILTLIHGK